MLIVSREDFIGKYAITLNDNDALQSYIDLYEMRYLNNLLGHSMYNTFVADLVSGVPVDLDLLTIFNFMCYEYRNKQAISDGIKDMLLGFIYFEYQRDIKFKTTTNGIVVNSNEVSEQAGNEPISMRYNEAVGSYKTIQYFIKQNLELYPTFMGIDKQYISTLN